MENIGLTLTESQMKLARDVWDGRDEGTHGWSQYGDKWLTIVPESEDGEDYLIVGITDEIDFLGYPLTEYIDYMFLDGNDFK